MIDDPTTTSIHFVPVVGPHGGKPSIGYAAFSTVHWHATTVALLGKIQDLISDNKMHEIMEVSDVFITMARTSGPFQLEELPAGDPLLLLGDDNINGDDSEPDVKGKSLPQVFFTPH